eukprot:TRINITY_DN564_c0_g1_i1.p1 TRINITY_DN564_c0_g1~~TRINITY_DN564_c0_g1_i1.p1  ORF type:complete len:147 (-),score=43.30 TRINITY_DN564_c0_g1_i1:49-489(-)
MSNHGPSYGLSSEVSKKINDKRSIELENEALSWVESVTGKHINSNNGDYSEDLRDGVTLCDLINKLKPGTIKKVNRNAKMPFIKMENINAFLEGCKAVGVSDLDVFMTVDLFEAKNMVKVTDTLISLKRKIGGGASHSKPQNNLFN